MIGQNVPEAADQRVQRERLPGIVKFLAQIVPEGSMGEFHG